MNMNKKIKVLLIDDDEEDFIITREMMSEIKNQEYAVEWVATYEKALLAMEKGAHDVFLIDYNLGQRSGLELIDEALRIKRDVPIIVLTGLDDPEIDELALKKGASDFLRKDKIDPELLEHSIRYAIEKKRNELQILYLAYYDQVTDLPNRVFFKEQVDFALAHAIRYNRKLAVIFLDLDNFKLVNDSLGHHFGDALLKEAARRLYGSIRKGDLVARNDLKTLIDTVARLGGDEFTISLTEIKAYEDASLVADRILQRLNEPFLIEGHEVFTGASLGIALYPADAADADTLLKYADNAMYYAKKQGKNCFQYYQQSMNDRAVEKIQLMTSLRKAVDRNEFVLFYQPKMDIKSGRLIGFEALIRWKRDGQNLIPPLEFIPFAETNHLIGFITDWVVREVGRQLADWARQNLSILPVSVNLPVTHFKKADLADHFKSVAAACGIAPRFFEFEVTESIFSDDMNPTISRLGELRAAGFQISIDDFGVGFSSLNRLKEMPCGILKIDKSFIRCVPEASADSVIVNSVILLGHGLNLAVLAEGVETAAQLDFLRRSGCDFLQGYLLSPPLPPEAIPDILRREARGDGIGMALAQAVNAAGKTRRGGENRILGAGEKGDQES
jgi:diguanylate cyclase (GGDEF)-like protein